jgi:hypothetical protein
MNAKKSKKLARSNRKVKDLKANAAERVKGGTLTCATGEHFKKVIVTP